MLTNRAYRRRQIMRKVCERVDLVGRYVDIGVELVTVRHDPVGEVLLEGKPPLVVVDRRRYGGIVDTKAQPPSIVAPSQAPRVWYASTDQAAAVLHDDPQLLGQLVYGSEGAGKTRTLAMWHYFQWIKHLGERREGGQTAPTEQRLEFVREEMRQLFAANWYRYVSSQDVFIMCDGSRIKLVSTYRQSKAGGSPIQGFNWSWCGRDEAQDQVDVHEDIESRGRSARNGMYRQMATATAKDDSSWRELRDVLIGSGGWVRRSLSIHRSPFVDQKFIAAKRSAMSEREFLRRYGDPKTGEVSDLPPDFSAREN